MDNDEVTGLVFVDFRKAFNVIKHKLLLKKLLSVYGASPDSMAWFWSYLEERRQFVKLGQIASEPKARARGTARGKGYCRDQSSVQFCFSYLWMICLYNFEQLHHWYNLYADDTTLSLSANWNNITSLTQALSNNLENIEKWSTKNNMYINTEKSKALVVTGKRLQHKLSEGTATLKLRLDTTNIDKLSRHKLLGLIIGKDLSFEAPMYRQIM